jgi:integrase
MARQFYQLTDLKVKRAKPGLHADGMGLYLRVTESGSRSWMYRYKPTGLTSAGGKPKTVWLGLGPAPIADGDGRVTLAEARDKAAKHRHQRFHGTDPKAAKDAAKAAAQIESAKNITFKVAAEKLIASKKSGWKSPKHSDQWGATLETYAYDIVGNTPVPAVDVGMVMKVLEQDVPAAAGKPGGRFWDVRSETASRVRGRIESVLDWATARGYRRGENPARWKGHLDNLLPRRSKVAKPVHYPALPYREIGRFMVDVSKQDGVAAAAMRYVILTATRTGETIGARWPEIDLALKVWTIPAERMKAGRPHRVPLSPGAITILSELAEQKDGGDGYVFPGGKVGRPLSNMALLALLERMERDDITTHGMRASFRTWAEEQTSTPREVIEMALAHTIKDKAEAAYRRGDLLDKRRPLMEAWGAFCAKPLKVGGDNVIAIGTKAAAE